MASRPDRERERLKAILLDKSVRFGEFTLASGQKSNVYVDGKLTTCTAEAMPLVGKLILRKIVEAGWKPEAVGGLTLGADPIAYAAARESLAETGRYIDAFVVRKEPKKHGMQRFIEGIEEVAALPVVIIEDVCTTGESTAQAIQKALATGMKVLGAVCLVDRGMGGREKLRAEFACELLSVFTLVELQSASTHAESTASPR